MNAERLILATENDRSSLSELDYLLCRNVEVTRANEEDVQGNTHDEGSCENVVVGQVGLRCIHCSSSPFATARCATMFPVSINHIGAALHMMAKWHFSRCGMSPSKVRKEMERELSVIEKEGRREKRDESMSSLKIFCASVVTKRFNLQNMHAYNTGMIFLYSRREEGPRQSTSQSPIGQSDSSFGFEHLAGNSVPYHNSQQFIAHSQCVASPTQHQVRSYLPSPQSGRVVPRYMHIPLSHRASYTPMDHQPNFPLSQLDHLQNFFRESMGWSCRHCASVPFQFRAPNSFYPYANPPASSFIDYHLQLCTGVNFYQPPNPHTFSHQGTLNLDEALDYLTSVSNFESTLVQEEDHLLLSDYLFYLIKQLQLCHFAESDRKTRGGKRVKVKIGCGGLECRHCAMKAHPLSSRKFFWSNVDRIANSFAEIPNHILNCKNCPDRVKKSLHALKIKHRDQMAKLPRGSQKVFFRRMWRRVHKDSPTENEKQQTMSDESTSATISTANHQISPSLVFLAMPEDKDWLSDTDCFIRRNLEVFCASHDDVTSNQTDSEHPITLGQVGIRCMHCASTVDGASGNAVNFPYAINRIYEAVREMQTLHLEHCDNLPTDASQVMENLKTSTSSLSSVSKRCYVLTARALGIIDTPKGMQMSREKLPITSTGSFNFKHEHDKAADEPSCTMNETNERKEGKTSMKRKSSPLTEDNKDCKKQNTS